MSTSVELENYKLLSQMDRHQLVGSEEVTHFLQISWQTLYRRCKEGLLPFVKVKRNVKFEVGAVLDYIETYRVAVT